MVAVVFCAVCLGLAARLFYLQLRTSRWYTDRARRRKACSGRVRRGMTSSPFAAILCTGGSKKTNAPASGVQ